MKIYVITKGEYSDYHICAVTENKEKAEILCEKFACDYETAQIEEYDTEFNELIINNKKAYHCYYKEDGDIEITEASFDIIVEYNTRVHRFSKDSWMYKQGNLLEVYLFANNSKDAIKKASDKFSKYRAEHMDL